MFILDGIYQFYQVSFLLPGHFDIWPVALKPGRGESPIAIEKKDVLGKEASPLVFHNYNKLLTAKLENTGHSVQVKAADISDTSILPKISGGILLSDYTLDNVHFHWVAEHAIDGKKFSMEGHFVHYDTKRQNLTNALKFDDGVVVLAVLYDEKKCINAAFKEISKNVEQVAKKTKSPIDLPHKINLYSLLPSSTESYYTYQGGLTTNSKGENVTWIVFDQPSFIDKKQLEKISDIYGDNKARITGNFRALQDLNGREVIYIHHPNAFDKVKDYFMEKCKEYLEKICKS